MSSNLLYTIGRIRALEGQMANSEHFERMVSASNAESAFAVLTELPFASQVGSSLTVRDYQIVLDASLSEARQIISAGGTSFPEMQVLWLKYDLGNLKSALRYYHNNEDLPEFTRENGFSPLGSLSAEEVTNLIWHEQNPNGVLKAFYEKIIAVKDYPDTTMAEKELMQSYFEALFELSKKFKNKFLKQFTVFQIDIENIRNISRSLLTLNRPLEQDEYISGGKMNIANVQTLSELQNVLKGTKFEYIFPRQEAKKTDTMAYIEKSLLNLYFQYLSEAESGEIDTVQIPLAYFEKRLHNANIIRFILTGKISGIPQNILEKRVSELTLS